MAFFTKFSMVQLCNVGSRKPNWTLVLGTKIQFVLKIEIVNSQKIEKFRQYLYFSNFGSEPILENDRLWFASAQCLFNFKCGAFVYIFSF
jgi:hypothetical protein